MREAFLMDPLEPTPQPIDRFNEDYKHWMNLTVDICVCGFERQYHTSRKGEKIGPATAEYML